MRVSLKAQVYLLWPKLTFSPLRERSPIPPVGKTSSVLLPSFSVTVFPGGPGGPGGPWSVLRTVAFNKADNNAERPGGPGRPTPGSP